MIAAGVFSKDQRSAVFVMVSKVQTLQCDQTHIGRHQHVGVLQLCRLAQVSHDPGIAVIHREQGLAALPCQLVDRGLVALVEVRLARGELVKVDTVPPLDRLARRREAPLVQGAGVAAARVDVRCEAAGRGPTRRPHRALGAVRAAVVVRWVARRLDALALVCVPWRGRARRVRGVRGEVLQQQS